MSSSALIQCHAVIRRSESLDQSHLAAVAACCCCCCLLLLAASACCCCFCLLLAVYLLLSRQHKAGVLRKKE